jgi:hypothetical protein
MQSPSSAENRPAPRKRLITLWLIVAVCAAPIVASYVAYYVFQPQGHVNYGELLPPRPVPNGALATLDGRQLRPSDLKGQWVLVVADAARCDERCRTKLVYSRQVRLAQGKESERVSLVWLVTDDAAPDPALLADEPDLHVLRAAGSDLVRALPAERSPAEHIYVIDPLGNLMMRFPHDPDPRRMLKDLARLLRHSQWK